jgi:hypothetical protein
MQFRLSLFTARAFAATLIAFSGCVLSDRVLAEADIRWHQPQVSYKAKNRDLRELLAIFAKAQKLELSIAPGINGRVIGHVRMPPQQLLDTLAKEHHFSWHVTGNILSITALERTTMPAQITSVAPVVAVPGPASGTLETPPPLTTWTTTPADKTLQNALARWSLTAGWQLVWELPQDISIEAAASINGSFEDAVTAIANSMQSSETPIIAMFFEGNRVLRIIAKGVQQ